MIKQEVERYVPVSKLKYYFAVDTRYVLTKLRLLFFPFTHAVRFKRFFDLKGVLYNLGGLFRFRIGRFDTNKTAQFSRDMKSTLQIFTYQRWLTLLMFWWQGWF